MIKVRPRAHSHEDRNGDPLDGLVNLFDLGIVLSVGFLLAALASLNLSGALSRNQKPAVPVQAGQTLHQLPQPGSQVTGTGVPVGTVYRLPDGRLVYVSGSPTPSPAATK